MQILDDLFGYYLRAAEVLGDVYTRRIVVLEGGSVNGSIKMGTPPEPGFEE